MGARIAWFCSFLTVTMLTGCGSQLLLNASFDADTVGELPDATLPGRPEGDVLYFPTVEAPLPTGGTASDIREVSAVLVASTGDPPPGLALRDSAGLSTPFIFFRAAAVPAGTQNYLVTWLGAASTPGDSRLEILLMSGHRNPGVSLKMSGGQFLIGEDEESLGSYSPLQQHTVIVAVDLDAETYNLTIHRTGASSLQVIGRPLEGDLVESSILELSFQWSGSHTGGVAYLDNVTITGGP